MQAADHRVARAAAGCAGGSGRPTQRRVCCCGAPGWSPPPPPPPPSPPPHRPTCAAAAALRRKEHLAPAPPPRTPLYAPSPCAWGPLVDNVTLGSGMPSCRCCPQVDLLRLGKPVRTSLVIRAVHCSVGAGALLDFITRISIRIRTRTRARIGGGSLHVPRARVGVHRTHRTRGELDQLASAAVPYM